MGADATLVNAAYRASMANVPGDWSRSFDKQYEGIMAADRALTAGLSRAAAKATGGIVTAYTERRKEEGKRESMILAAQALHTQKSDAADTLLMQNAAENTYADASDGLNPAIRNAAYTVPTDIHNNILKRSKKVFKTKKDKQYIAEQYTRLESWKRDRINDKANIKQLSDALNNGLINKANMDPDYKVLLAQLLDNKGDFNLKGINVYNRKSDDKLMIEFTPNRLESEAEYNKRMREVDGGPSVYQTQPVAPYSDEAAAQATSQVISFQDLMNGVNYKETEKEKSVVEVKDSQVELAAERDKHSDTFKYTSEAALAKINRELSGVIKGQKVVSDFATRDILGRGTTYREELTGMVGNMDLSQFGVVDKGDPGYEDDMKDDLLREEIVGRLINPKNPSDLKFAEEEMLKYFTDLSMQSFNNKRKEIEGSQTDTDTDFPTIDDKNVPRFQFATGNVDEEGKREYTSWQPTIYGLMGIDKDLQAMKTKGKDSMDSEEYVNINGLLYGFDSKTKRFLQMQSRGDAGLFPLRDKNEKVKYFESPKDIFQHHNIPVTWITSNKLESSDSEIIQSDEDGALN